MMTKTLLTTALLTALALPTTVAATQVDTTLDPVIVTATRTAITADEALSSVSVITRDDIQRLQPVSLVDLLRGLPGVTLTQSGGLGGQTSLFLRGTNSTHTLVLVDGIRIGSVSAGLTALEQIPVEQIERIELVRGPRSSLYGADAIGGVIQIFTRHGHTGGGIAPSLSVTAGSRGLAGGQFGLSGGDRHAWYNLSVGGKYTSGFPYCRMGAAEAGAGCFADDPRDDAFRNWNGLLDAGYRWDNGTELAVTGLRSKSYVEYGGSPYGGNRALEEQRVAGARLSFAPLEPWKVTLSAGQSRDLSATAYQGTYYGVYYPSTATGYTSSRRNQASWQNDISLGAGQLLSAGVDYRQEHLASSTSYLASNISDTGVFAQYQGSFGRNEVQLSARHDHNGQFGNHNTGAAAWGYRFDHGLRLTASYGTAFHAPTFNDLYYPPYGATPSANPDLKPETSRSAELGLSQQGEDWNWALNAYQTRIRDLIALNDVYYPENISRARIRGLEAQAGTRLAGWRVQAYLTLLQPTNDGGARDPNDGKQLARRPRRTARLDLDRRFGAFGVGASFYAAGQRYDDAANLHRIGGYATADLRASYALDRSWSLSARLANVFDRKYETIRYFNQPGRSWFLTLRYAPSPR